MAGRDTTATKDRMTTVHLYSDAFAEEMSEETLVVHPSQDLWRQWMEENPTADRLFVRIRHPASDESFLAAVGDPVRSSSADGLYLPTWMIDANQFEGCGEEALVSTFRSDSLQKATRIVVRPVDSALLDIDIVSALEKVFSRMGVLQQGKTILVHLEELGGFPVAIHIATTEPAEEVFLDGDDIPLEFEEAVDYVEQPPAPAPAPAPVERPVTPVPKEPVNFGQMFTEDASGFQPFRGQGYRLGSA